MSRAERRAAQETQARSTAVTPQCPHRPRATRNVPPAGRPRLITSTITCGVSQRAAKALAKLSSEAAEVILVRHGETDWNLERRLQGQDQNVPGINENGRLQAHALARFFAAEHELGNRLDAVYSSDLARAVETAEVIATAIGLRVEQSAALRERHLGLLQGLTTEEAAVLQPAALEVLRYARDDVPNPGADGESVTAMQNRAASAVEHIAAQHPGGRVLIVAHGGVLNALHKHALGRNYSKPFLNAARGVVLVERGRPWVLVCWNEVGHLDGSGQPDAAGFGGGRADG